MILYEEFCILENNVMKSVESHPTFRRNISSPYSGQNKPSKQRYGSVCAFVQAKHFLHVGFFFKPED
jgi:hypothetical protein